MASSTSSRCMDHTWHCKVRQGGDSEALELQYITLCASLYEPTTSQNYLCRVIKINSLLRLSKNNTHM